MTLDEIKQKMDECALKVAACKGEMETANLEYEESIIAMRAARVRDDDAREEYSRAYERAVGWFEQYVCALGQIQEQGWSK